MRKTSDSRPQDKININHLIALAIKRIAKTRQIGDRLSRIMLIWTETYFNLRRKKGNRGWPMIGSNNHQIEIQAALLDVIKKISKKDQLDNYIIT